VYPPDSRTLVALALLATAAAGSSLLLLGSDSADELSVQPPELSLAFYLDKARLTGTGQRGEIVYQVWTDKAAQSASDASITMDGVRMLYGPPQQIPWKLRANSGSIPANARIIELAGNVVAVAGDKPQNQMVIHTERMDIEPALREARTADAVVIDYNGRLLNALGMRANLATNQLELLADVNGQFTP